MDRVNTGDATVQVKCQRCPLPPQLSSQLQFSFYSPHTINLNDKKDSWTDGPEIHVYLLLHPSRRPSPQGAIDVNVCFICSLLRH